ncbi:zinc finger protein 16 [Diachasma alloeum]|uniref:zinc finger protein 16 n=1 Tax=Diachasma alloeum TaxID=454923 RepID=UPI00073832A3|nr:zinc finger protein 16 [Diachasma alloeum]
MHADNNDRWYGALEVFKCSKIVIRVEMMLNVNCERERLSDTFSPSGDNFRGNVCVETRVNNANNTRQLNYKNVGSSVERPFVCLECDMSFERASQLDYHQRSVHLGEKTQICQICGKRFFRKADLNTHLNIHLGTNQSVCNICGRKFNHVSNLIRHSRVHAGMKPYPCSICGKRFTQISSVVRHKRIHEKKSNSVTGKDEDTGVRKLIKRRHYCKICGDTFPFIVLLRQHERRHFGADGSVECERCKLQFGTQSLLRDHKCSLPAPHDEKTDPSTNRLVHVDLGQQLFELEIDYLSQKDLDQSRSVSSLDESVEVCLINKDLIEPLDLQSLGDLHSSFNLSGSTNPPNETQRFPEDSDLEQVKPSDFLTTFEEIIGYHENQTPGVRLVQHEEGDQFFELVRDPLTYLGDSKSYDRTQETDDSNSNGIENIQDLANDKVTTKKRTRKKSSSDKSRSQEQKYECTICKKKFSTASNLKQHTGTHFLDQQKFHCKECGMSFAWKSTLNKHLASNHRPDGPQKFVCEICPRVYSTLSQVNEHVKRDHLKVRNHVCEECGKSFFKKFDLKSHRRTHTKERPYVCRVCDKTFYHQSHIIRHERIHSGERPYSCDFCQKTFSQLSSLRVHKQRHQNETRMDILEYQNNEDDPMALNSF